MVHRRIGWLLCVALMAAPSTAEAQGVGAVLGAVAQGGGWIQIPIQGGQGSLLTTPIPSVGLRLEGCMQIWPGHSGSWSVAIEDTYGNGSLETEASPGQHVPFEYRPGAFAQLQVDVEWSEPRDTSLIVWVGVAGPADRDPCEPVYGDGGGDAVAR